MKLRLPNLRQLVSDQLRDQLRQALPQAVPGVLTMTCECQAGRAQIDRELTGEDLVTVTRWLDQHSGHGARAIILEIPAGTDTKVGIPL